MVLYARIASDQEAGIMPRGSGQMRERRGGKAVAGSGERETGDRSRRAGEPGKEE